MKNQTKSLSLWSFKSMRLLLSLTFCLVVLVNAMMQNTLAMAMVCMVNSTNVHQENQSEIDADPSCGPEDNGSNDYQGTFNWGSMEQGFMFSAFFIGGLITTLPAGWMADRYDPKTMVIVSICMTTIGCLLTPVTAMKGGYIGLIVLRFIMGLTGQALIITGISSISARWIPPVERSTVVALYTVGNQIANVIGMPLNALLCHTTSFLGGWPAIFYVNGTLGFVSGVVWMIVASNRPETNRFISENEKIYIASTLAGQNLGSRKDATKNIPWKRMMTSPALITCLFSMFAGGLMTAALSNYIPTYLKEALHIDLMNNGLLSALPYILQSFGKIAFALISDLVKRKTNISHTWICKFFNTLECFGVAAFLVACSFMDCSTSGWAVAFLSLANLMLSAAAPGFMTSIVCLAPAYTGIVMALTRFAGQVAAVLAPLMVASLTRQGTITEWQHVFYVIAAIMLISGIFFVIFGSATIQPWAKLPHGVSNIKVNGTSEIKIVPQPEQNNVVVSSFSGTITPKSNIVQLFVIETDNENSFEKPSNEWSHL